jgi:putative endonuclease
MTVEKVNVIIRLDRVIHKYMSKDYYVYILASRKNGTLYVGVTSDLIRRVWEHKNKLVEGFTKKYNRKWKLELIGKANPEWRDLYSELISGFPDQVRE